MNSGYIPPQPSGNSKKADWLKHQHQVANRERRILFTPNSLTIQTPAGVIHRPKPVDSGDAGGGGDLPVWL